MAVAREFLVKLLADTSQFEKAFGALGPKVKEALGGADADLKKIVPAFAAVTAASAAAFAGITAFATKATQAAIEDQAEQEKLAQTLRNVTGATDETVASTEKFIAELAKTTTFTDSQMRPALSALAVATGDVTRAQELLTTAQDISIATGTDLGQVSEALAKASQGNMKALQSLSPTLRDNIKEGQSFNQVLQELNTNFGGAAQAAGQTLAGQMTILRNRFDEIVESIGTAFVPILESLVGLLSGVTTFIENNTLAVVFLITAVGTITGQITLLVSAFAAYKTALFLASAANTLFGATLTATGIGAIIVLIGLLVAAFVTLIAKTGGVGNAFKTLGNVVAAAWEFVVNLIIKAINFVTSQINRFTGLFSKIGIEIGEIGPISEVSFGRFEMSVKEAGGRLSIFNSQLAATQGNMIRFESAIKSENRARLAGAQAMQDYFKEQEKVNKGTGGATEKTKTAAEKLKEYTQVLKSAQSASKSFGDAQKRTSKAQESVAEADLAVAKAQQALLKAQQAGSPAEIADAQRAVAAAERGLARAKFGQEEAIIAVRDAEKKLADIRKDPESTPDEIRRAEIALAEAKFSVADAEDNQIKVAEDLTEARRQLRIATEGLREGDAELVPLQDAVTTAQLKAKDASDALNEAIQDQTDALDNYREALEELGKVAENFPKIAAKVGAPGLIPVVPAPTPTGAATGTTTSPQAVNATITVNSSVVNSAQVGQEIYEYLQDYVQIGGDVRLSSVR
jgi:hypothetical protein